MSEARNIILRKLPDQKELKELVAMAKDFEVQRRKQSETARKIATECEEALKDKQNKREA